MAMTKRGRMAARGLALALAAAVAGCGVDGPPRAPAGSTFGTTSGQQRSAPVTPGKTVSSEPLPVTVSGHAIVGVST